MTTAEPAVPPGRSERLDWIALAGAILAISIYAVAQGLTYPLLALILERQGHSASAIGLSGAMTPLGFMVAAPLVPALARRFGASRTAITCILLAMLILLAIAWTRDIAAWFPLRFMLGAVVLPLYVISEVWIIELAPAHRRARIVGLYTATISAGFASGPLILSLVGSEGWPPFLIAVLAFVGCASCLYVLRSRLPALGAGGGKNQSVWAFLPLAPLLLLAVFVTAASEQSILSLLPVYALNFGLTERGTSALLTALFAGNVALQVPLGFAAERWGTRTVVIACALGSALGAALLPMLIGTPAMWPMAVVWGALSFGMYTISIAELGNRFTGQLLVAGNSAFALFWGIGGIAGPPATGLMMDVTGVQGLPIALGVMSLALAVTRMARR